MCIVYLHVHIYAHTYIFIHKLFPYLVFNHIYFIQKHSSVENYIFTPVKLHFKYPLFAPFLLIPVFSLQYLQHRPSFPTGSLKFNLIVFYLLFLAPSNSHTCTRKTGLPLMPDRIVRPSRWGTQTSNLRVCLITDSG